jgi:hypothetical protein
LFLAGGARRHLRWGCCEGGRCAASEGKRELGGAARGVGHGSHRGRGRVRRPPLNRLCERDHWCFGQHARSLHGSGRGSCRQSACR